MNKKELLDELYAEYKNIFSDKEVVLGEGNSDAKILLVGEAPGRDEVRLSRPFVGMAGKNLDEFLQLLEIDRHTIYITNAIKFRLSKLNPVTGRIVNRPASKDEILFNRRFLIEELKIIKPAYIVSLGNVPLKSVTNDFSINIGEVHGRIKDIIIEATDFKLFPLYHPASIIYTRSLKEVYVSDIKKFGELIN
jgi:uracil-DNA glycosylase